MDLWGTLGISPQVGLLVAIGGVLAAIAVAYTLLFRRSRVRNRDLDLGQPR
jgi:hypothetical protein